MTQFKINAQDTETSSHYTEIRFVELADQRWDRNKSTDLAQSEGISLNDEHWAVIVYLRRHYLEHGLPRNARTLAKTLNQQFSLWAEAYICTGFFQVVRLHKAAALPICAPPQTPSTLHLAVAIEMH